MMHKPIVILGGGLAGSTAALALARQRAAQVILIEPKSRLGGRVGSYTDQATGQSIDYCQHVGMNCCSALKQLIQWLDQADQWRTERELFFYGPQEQRQRLRGSTWLPAPLHLISWLWNWPGLTLADRLAIARGMRAIDRVPLKSSQADALEQLSALQWLSKHGQSPRVLERFWSTIIVSALGEELQRVSLTAVAKVFQDGFLRHRDAYHLLVPQRPLSELFGSQMIKALAELQVDVRLNTKVQSIRWHGAQARQILLTDGAVIEPSQVIASVPWHAIPPLVKDCNDAAIQAVATRAGQLGSSPISGVHTWWDRAWLPTPHAVLVGRLCQWIFPSHQGAAGQSTAAPDHTAAASSEHYYQIVISASRCLPRGDSDAVGRLLEADLHDIFPEARAARLVRLRVVTDPTAVFSIAPGSAGLRPLAGSQLGNLIWAGDWTATGWPATMEGAIRSGLAAAATASLDNPSLDRSSGG